jgi:hypothetical protein
MDEDKKHLRLGILVVVLAPILIVLVVAVCIFLFKSLNSGFDWILLEENRPWIFFGGVPLILTWYVVSNR